MNGLVVGGGLLGRKVAEMLDAAGHDVSVIDESEENLSLLDSDFDGVTSVGFPMDIEALKNAGIESCDAVAVTTADDNLNITVGQIAKNVFGIENVVSRISDPYRESVFESFGLKSVCPTNMAGEKIVSALTSPMQSKQVTYGATTVALSVIPVEKKQVGKYLTQLETRPGDGLFGVLKGDGKFLLKTEDTQIMLAAGDSVVVSRKID